MLSNTTLKLADGAGRRLSLSAGLLAALLSAPALAGTEALTAQDLGRILILDAVTVGKRILAVGEWGTIVASADGGRTWTRSASATEETLTDAFFVDDQVGWVVGHNGVILATADGGQTWQEQTPRRDAVDPFLGVFFFNRQHGFVVGPFGAFYETDDGGRSWRHRDILQSDVHLKAITGTADGHAYVGGEGGLVLRSADFGRTWQVVRTGYRGSFWGAVTTGPSSVVMFGMRGTVYRSDDHGETWALVPTHTKVGLSAGAALTENDLVLAGAEGTVLESRDGGRSFKATSLHDRSGINAVVALSPDALLLLGRTAPNVFTVQTP